MRVVGPRLGPETCRRPGNLLREPSLLEGRDLGKERKVAIMMENQQTIPKGARGN